MGPGAKREVGRRTLFDDRLAVQILLKNNKREIDFLDFDFFAECVNQMGLRCGINPLVQRKHILDALERSSFFEKEIRKYQDLSDGTDKPLREYLGRAFVLKPQYWAVDLRSA